jgi:hypothetical protein
MKTADFCDISSQSYNIIYILILEKDKRLITGFVFSVTLNVENVTVSAQTSVCHD